MRMSNLWAAGKKTSSNASTERSCFSEHRSSWRLDPIRDRCAVTGIHLLGRTWREHEPGGQISEVDNVSFSGVLEFETSGLQQNITLQWPSHSSDLNTIENLLQDLKTDK